MKYLMLVCVDPELVPENPGDIHVWLDMVGDRRLDGGPLKPTATATTVRVRRSERLVSDGPFAETKEIVGGFDILECDSQEEAVELAAAHPVAAFGSIEVREIVV